MVARCPPSAIAAVAVDVVGSLAAPREHPTSKPADAPRIPAVRTNEISI
jgi:hypothetical protein